MVGDIALFLAAHSGAAGKGLPGAWLMILPLFLAYLYGAVFAWAHGGNDVLYQSMVGWTNPWWDGIVEQYVPGMGKITQKFIANGYGERVGFGRHVFSMSVMFSVFGIAYLIVFFRVWLSERKYLKAIAKMGYSELGAAGFFLVGFVASWAVWLTIMYAGARLENTGRDWGTRFHESDWAAANFILLCSVFTLFAVFTSCMFFMACKVWWNKPRETGVM